MDRVESRLKFFRFMVHFAESINIRCNDEMSFLHDWHADQIHWDLWQNNPCFLIGGNSNIVFMFTPKLGEDFQFEYVSNGLVQPPTSFVFFHLVGFYE